MNRWVRVFLPCCVLAAVVLACTGSSLDEEVPGGMLGTYLESGQIAVDPRTETAFVLREVVPQGASAVPARRALYAVRADATTAEAVTRLDDTTDARMLFGASGIVLMTEQGGGELLRLLDGDTHRELRRRSTSARYHGTRLSPTGRWIAVADNDRDSLPIHLLDTATLDTVAIPHDGEWLEGVWLHGGDRFVAVVAYEQLTDAARMRILSWDVDEVKARDFEADESGFWPGPDIDVTIDGVGPDLLFSFTWVGVSPDDRYAVFPVLGRPASEGAEPPHRLLVLDLATRELRTVEDAYGPVGFTPDGSTIVSYRYVGQEDAARSQLRLVDVTTLETEDLELPLDGLPEYFVSREGNFVVVADVFGNEQLVLVDLDQGTVSQLAGPAVAFESFVVRPGRGELWLADDGLYRVDLMGQRVDPVPVSLLPAHLNILPSRDQLLLVPPEVDRMAVFDPETRAVVREVAIPEP